MPDTTPKRSSWQQELDDLLRGIAGAFLFGTPLLYTMEVWWKGNFTSPPRMLVGLALTYAALVAVNRTTGFRSRRPSTWGRSLFDSAEALALGLLTAALSLLLLRRITLDTSLHAIMGRIILEGIPFGIGVGVANGLLRGPEAAGDGEEKGETEAAASAGGAGAEEESLWRGTLADTGSTLLGATIIALAIAPTDEIPMIASSLSPPWLLGLMAASLVVSYVIVFEADFGSREARAAHRGLFQSPSSETVFSYVLSLLAAAGMLWLFQIVRPEDPWSQWTAYTLVLGLPATIGGAAGRVFL